ncbi:MAG: bifunctional riboflavin kinase/FAD synthetase [Eubacterium sp.]|nr:bifunctional riboflavin kinase/FAD synthetase [Eubacterium sp.]
MEIWESIPEDFTAETALCIGKFDGFHRGHRLLLDEAKNSGLAVTVLTFVFNKTETIDSVEEKRSIAAEAGVEYYIEMEAGPEFFSLSPEEFIRNIVSKKLHAGYVIVGEDFRFGKDRAGDIGTLKEYESSCGYHLIAVPKMQDEHKDISSSRIRECIVAGEMEDVERLLGRPYRMTGIVTDGNRIGRQMGFPTANMVPASGKVLPPSGVYAVSVHIGEDEYPGIGNLGTKPTVGDDNPLGLEVHIFDYHDDLYDKEIVVDFRKFLREEKRFDSVEELHRQIEEDIRRVKNQNGIDKE